MAQLNGSEILAKALKREGVEDVFFLMGGPMLTAEAATINEGIRCIDVRHEQAAAMMAQAYSRLHQRPGFCMAASGPATINLSPGLANALIAHIVRAPVLIQMFEPTAQPHVIRRTQVIGRRRRFGTHNRDLVTHFRRCR